ncbi:MAG: PAS domain-containing protein [Steroidobacteraceae bacterium]
MPSLNEFDWSHTPLGPRHTWSAALVTTYDIIMDSSMAMCAAWGAAKTLIYNHAYIPFLGNRHPAALGRPFDEVWHEVWTDIEPLVERAMAGESVHFENMHLKMTRKGYAEDTWWTFTYSPLREAGRIVGVLRVGQETTATVKAQARSKMDAERVRLALAAGAIIGTWVWHVPSNSFTVDEAFALSFGLDPELGRVGLSLEQVTSTVHPQDKTALVEAISRVLATGGPYAHQYRVRRADGRYYWIEANGMVELAADGTAVNFPGVLINAEQRRLIEGERDRALTNLRALNAELEQKVIAHSLARGRTWQLSPDILGVINSAGYFEASNPAWLAALGWSEAELAATVFFDFIHPDDLQRTRQAWQDAHEHGVPALRFENRYRHKHGGWRWLSWVAVPDEGRIYCSARDITDQKESELQLRDRTLERDRLWESTNDLMGTAAADGYLKAINPAWSTSLGWSEAELLSRPLLEIIDVADHAATVDSMRRLAAGEALTGFINHVLCRDGSARTIMWTATPHSGSSLFHIVGRDITQLRAAEEALRHSQKMEAVGQLTGGLAHDFNNLLAGLSGSLQLMSLRLSQGRLDDLENYLSVARGATRRAAALTHRLLAFSRKQTLLPQATDIAGLVDGLLDLVQRTAGPEIRIEVDAAPGLWLARVDVSQLENAVLNLCLNARDAMPHGGRITITARNRKLSAVIARNLEVPEGEYLSLCIRDTGTGMAPEVLARAFDPFFTTKPAGAGTGLGLSMIYGFAQQSGGQVHIESAPGAGTTVCLYLPRYIGEAEQNAIHPDDTAALPQARHGETILIVDDEAPVRTMVNELLSEVGYSTIEAADGNAGLCVLKSDLHIDLLVTDVGLPGGMNGRQLADHARSLRPDLKVIFITGYSQHELITSAQSLRGEVAVMTKPFELDELAHRIHHMLAPQAV